MNTKRQNNADTQIRIMEEKIRHQLKINKVREMKPNEQVYGVGCY